MCYLGFRPKIALEELDSGAPRIGKIIDLIRTSRYAIHDLSRLQARRRGEFYRLNMPLELGTRGLQAIQSFSSDTQPLPYLRGAALSISGSRIGSVRL